MNDNFIQFQPPKTNAEALARRQVLIDEVVKLQAILGRRGDFIGKEKTVKKVYGLQKELRLLKDWLRNNHDKNQQQSGIAFIKNGMNGICNYIESLQLYANNLRERLSKYENNLPDVPGFGLDWWREQT